MRDRKQQKPFLRRLEDDSKSTNDTIEILRQLDQAGNSLADSQADAGYESTYGPRTIKQKFWLGLRRFGRSIWRELGYVGMEVRKLLLILVFNFAAIFLFFWLLSLI